MISEIYQPGDPVADILFNWMPLLGALLVCVLGGVMLLLGFRTYLKAALLRKSGIKGQAVVREKWLKKGTVDREDRKRTTVPKHHYLRYELETDGRVISAKEVAPIDLWRKVQPGDKVDVIYLPRGRMMRLAGWSHLIGHGAGAGQLIAGAVMVSGAVSTILGGAFSAMSGPEYQEPGPDWVADQTEVLFVGRPADPFLRLFAPGKRYVQVVFGDTRGGALMANQRLVLLTLEQMAGRELTEGNVLKAWIDPDNEYNAILDLEVIRARP
jgi:hypothetical protein